MIDVGWDGAGARMRCAVILLGLVCCGLPPVALAQSSGAEIRITTADCPAAVKLVARNAPLSEVLRKLAQSLDFELQFDASSDPLVNLDAAMPAPELVAKLLPGDNVIVTQSRDRRCPGQYRIAKLRVLRKSGDNGVARAAAIATPAEQSQRYEEMSRQAKEAYQEYVRRHGKPPPGEPEEIGAPR